MGRELPPMFLIRLLSFVAPAALFVWIVRQLRIRRECRAQVAFVRQTLADSSVSETRRIIVSLSTLPDRIANLRPTLRCLLAQTRPPDEIVIAIPTYSLREQQPYLIPAFLSELPTVRILQAERDWGPATKFIPVIRDELASDRPDTLIMVVDDDRIYPRDAVECYLHYSAQLPDAALCFRGAAMPETFDWHDARMIHGNRLRSPRAVAVITGCGSYLVKPRFFDERLWDYSSAPPAAFYMDDIWISGWLDRLGVKKFVAPSSTRLRTVQEQAGTMSLHDVPNGRQPNNNEVIRWFRESWNVFPTD